MLGGDFFTSHAPAGAQQEAEKGNPGVSENINAPGNIRSLQQQQQQQSASASNAPTNMSANSERSRASLVWRDKRTTVIMPVTLKMVTLPYLRTADDGDVISECVLAVARIAQYSESDSQVLLRVTDDTAAITLQVPKRPLTHDSLTADKPYYLQQMAYSQNMYVKCTFTWKTFRDQIAYYCQHIAPVTNFNEVSSHYLEVILRHCQRTKGFVPLKAGAEQQVAPHKQRAYAPTAGGAQHGQCPYKGETLSTKIYQCLDEKTRAYEVIYGKDVIEEFRRYGYSMQAIDDEIKQLAAQGVIAVQDGGVLKLTVQSAN